MANINTITVDELIAEAYSRTDSEDSRDEIIFRNWIYRSLKWIGPASSDIKTATIPVEDLSIRKPCDYWFPVEMQLLSNQGGVFYFQYSNNSFIPSESLSRNNIDCQRKIVIGEDNDFFHINSNGASIAKCELNYYALPIDDNGDPLISEESIEAVLAYINWNWLKRQRNRYRGRSMFPMSEIESAKMEWIAFKGMVQGNRKMPSPLQAETVMRKWVSALPNFQNKRRHKNRITRGRNV